MYALELKQQEIPVLGAIVMSIQSLHPSLEASDLKSQVPRIGVKTL